MDIKETLNAINFYKMEQNGVECEIVRLDLEKVVIRAAQWLTLLSCGYIEIAFEKPFYFKGDILSTMDSTGKPFIELLSGKEEKEYLNKYLEMDRDCGRTMNVFRINLEDPIVIGAENIFYQACPGDPEFMKRMKEKNKDYAKARGGLSSTRRALDF